MVTTVKIGVAIVIIKQRVIQSTENVSLDAKMATMDCNVRYCEIYMKVMIKSFIKNPSATY